MGKPFFLDPVDYISGKIAKKFHTIYCFRKESQRRYTSVRSERKTKPSQVELLLRNKFGTVARATNTRLKDLNQSAVDQQAFRAQSTYKTLRQYVWHKELEKWEQENS